MRFSNVISTAIVLATMLSTAAISQSGSDEVRQLVANRDKKLSSEFLKRAAWTTDYDQAKKQAAESGRLIFAYFTRSYAPCGPCMQLENQILSKSEFIEFSKSVVLFCHISSRVPNEPHGFLFAEKGGNAFPTLMVLDQDGNVLARQCGERSMRAIRETVASGRAFADQIRRAETCDDSLKYDCLCKQVEYGHLAPDCARAKAQSLCGLSADRKAFLDASIVSRECALALLDIRKASDEDGQFAAASKLVEMKKAGRIPSDQNVFPFWEWVMGWANRHHDVKLYEDGLVAMQALLPNDPERLRDKQDRLNDMKRGVRMGAAGVVPH